MEQEKSIYRKILATTGMFGGVQAINMLCSLVRNKVIALLLGAEGVGVIGLYNGAIEMVSALTGMGLRQSSVRDVSLASNKPAELLKRVIGVVRKLSLVLGLLGAMIFISMAPTLSKVTFGTDDNMWGFVILSAALLFNALSSGEQAILQGTKQLKIFAKSTVAGSIASLIVSLPLYYVFGMRGIVPSLLASSFFIFIFNYIASKRCRLIGEKVTIKESFKEGSPMLRLGVYMTISSFITTLLNYVLIAWLNKYSSTQEVGYYQAGFTLITRYVGVIFIVMSTEYYPRLSANSQDNREVSKQVSHQMESSLLMLLPIASLFLLLQDWIIPLLYSSEFSKVAVYTTWALPGVMLKAISWSLGYVLLAKGEGKLFLITELISDITSLAINILLYTNMGLEGLGIAYTVNFAIYAIYMWIICRIRYKFTPQKRLYTILAVIVAIVVILLVMQSRAISIYFMLIPVILSVIYSAYSLLRRVK